LFLTRNPKAKFIELIKICSTAGYQNTEYTVIAASARFDHTQNSNHFDQNIGLIKQKLSLLVNKKYAECNVSQEKKEL